MLTVTQRASADLRTFTAFIWRSNSFACCLTICRCSARLCRNCSQTNVSLASHVTSTNAGDTDGRVSVRVAEIYRAVHQARPERGPTSDPGCLSRLHTLPASSEAHPAATHRHAIRLERERLPVINQYRSPLILPAEPAVPLLAASRIAR
jgi:hypothetical protein